MPEEPNPPYKYRVFLSYSHEDSRWARWLHRALETYRVPRHLATQADAADARPRGITPVFRDREDFSTSANLSSAVNLALQSSENLVVICSPSAAKSRWVNEEVLAFKRLGKAGQIFCFVVGGEPNAGDETECFPPAVRFELDGTGALSSVPAEPLAADARPQGDGRNIARLKLIAGLLGVEFDQLRQRDLQRRHRRMLFMTSGSMLIAVLTITLAVMAVIANARAERRRAQAEDLIGFMLGDLQEGLNEIGRLDIFMRVGNKAMEYFASLADEDVGDETLSQRSKALRQIGNARLNLGETALALESFREALAIAQKLADRDPDNDRWQIDLANSHFYVGFVHWQRGDLEAASAEFETVLPIVNAVSARNPDNAEWLAERGYAYTNLGRVLELKGQLEQALEVYREVQTVNDRLLELEPDNTESLLEVGFAHNNIGKVMESLGRLQEAEKHYTADLAIKQRVSEAHPKNNLWRNHLAISHVYMARIQVSRGQLPAARKHYAAALEIFTNLLLIDAANPDWLSRKASYERELAAIDRREEKLDMAAQRLESCRGIFKQLLAIDGSVALWQREAALADLEKSRLMSQNGDHTGALALSESAQATLAGLLEREPGNLENRQVLIVAQAVRGNLLFAATAPDMAQAAWQAALQALDRDFPATRNPELLDLRAALLVRAGRADESSMISQELAQMGYARRFN